MTEFVQQKTVEALLSCFTPKPAEPYTLNELIRLAEEKGTFLSHLVVAQAMVQEGLDYAAVLEKVVAAFRHNLGACELGLTEGKSFLLGKVASDLAKANLQGPALIGDELINRAVTYTLATEVGNHEVGLSPCAGTGDSCPYTGLLRAIGEHPYPEERIAQVTALILKIGSVFRAGKETTGCNMEGLGAGAAVTAAVLTELRGGTPAQVGKAIVLALSPTIAVPCTPRVMVQGLCAMHISGAILLGNQAANLVLKTSLPMPVDVDVMVAMAARIHKEAAPVITKINIPYLRPFFETNAEVERLVPPAVLAKEAREREEILEQARAEVRRMVSQSGPLTRTLGDVVFGGSSMAVGSPTNMGRLAHALAQGGDIKQIRIELTLDLYSRRAINVPGILMGALYGAATEDIESYRNVVGDVLKRGLPVELVEVSEPEVQRIRIETDRGECMVDSRNRGGGRLTIVDALPSREAALKAAERLGIVVAP
ncbi:MAG: L-serine ammonia-lyase, iron-sulfur-dependent, subunit alpha [Syntrophaceae bacterium]|nr:L-serine ammonia-lyase, iron-sulfur-dependent, subunit alpha [Syntrophaceae bacterium]